MTPNTLLSLLAAIALGVLLVLWGRRGKRLNKNPTCRDCRFDLTGVYPESITCPECGAGLNRPKGVAMGVRRTRWIPIALGVVLVLLPGATLGLTTFVALTGQDLNDYKPVALLIWEGEHATRELVQSSGEQLLERYQNAELTSEQISQVCLAALRTQGNPDRPWHGSWGDILVRAHLDGSLTDEQHDTYLDHSAIVEITTRNAVLVGDAIPIKVRLIEIRAGSDPSQSVGVSLTAIRLNGKQVRTGISRVIPIVSSRPDGQFIANLRTPTGVGMPANGLSEIVELPRGLTAHSEGTLRIEIDYQTTLPGRYLGARNNLSTDSSPSSGTFNLTTVALPTGEVAIAFVGLTDDLRQEMRRRLAPQAVTIDAFPVPTLYQSRRGSDRYIHVRFDLTKLPMDVAFLVEARHADDVWTIGTIVSKAHAGNVIQLGPNILPMVASNRQLTAGVPNGVDGPIDIILRPHRGTARRTTEIYAIYGEEIVFEDVEVDWTDR